MKRNLVAEIKERVITYEEFRAEFLYIMSKEIKTQIDFQFLRDSLEVLKTDPKTLS